MDLEILERPLTEYPIRDSVREHLVKSLWVISGAIPSGNGHMAAYFEYYSKRAQRLFLPRQRQVLQTHADLVSIASKISSRSNRADIHQEIVAQAGTAVSAEEVDDAIDLCASLLVMAEVQLRESPFCLSGCTPVHWKEGSLDMALTHHFTAEAACTLGGERPRFERLFNAYNLNRIAGIKLKWTCNLADHLRLVDDDRTVLIFHCVSFLQLQQR